MNGELEAELPKSIIHFLYVSANNFPVMPMCKEHFTRKLKKMCKLPLLSFGYVFLIFFTMFYSIKISSHCNGCMMHGLPGTWNCISYYIEHWFFTNMHYNACMRKRGRKWYTLEPHFCKIHLSALYSKLQVHFCYQYC